MRLVKMTKSLVPILLVTYLAGCDAWIASNDARFGKQNFVSAVSIIELHNARNGAYPRDLDDLQFLGDWDSIWLSAVRYEKVADGYNLFVERGWMGEPDLSFPVGFKKGLGIRDVHFTLLSLIPSPFLNPTGKLRSGSPIQPRSTNRL